jgi:small subunit ribosomal protein S16
MAMKLRLARHGRKDRPYYWIMAADARAPRSTGKEKIGSYDPLRAKDDPQRVVLNTERAAYWLKCGAQPTDRVHRFLAQAGLVTPKTFPPRTTQTPPAA